MYRLAPALSKRLLLAAALAVTGIPAMAQEATTTTATTAEPLQEIIVTGSRIAAPNEVSTSPIVDLSSKYIQISGKTDISDLIGQLPQQFTNDLGQDLGNGTSGLTTAGGVATADLRGLGLARTLVLIDGRRLGVGSPNTAIAQPGPDLDQIPAGLVDRVEVVTGGASAAYGSDAIAGVVNFIMKRNFEGFQVDGQYDENRHNNGNTYVQSLVTAFGSQPPTGTTTDGRQRLFDMMMGTNFADGKGNITAFLSYRHADPVASSQRDFGACQLFPTFNATTGNVNGITCDGSSNSNWFQPTGGFRTPTGFIPPAAGAGASVYSTYGSSWVPWGTVATTPPAVLNSQSDIYMTREDDRYNGAYLARLEVNDAFQPYSEFFFMQDKTHVQVAPAALFKDSNPLDPTGAGDYYINCSNPLLSAQQAGLLCTPAQIAADAANPGTVQAQVRIGRRNIEGGQRFTDFDHINYRAVLGSKGDFLDDAWSYDVYGQYFYTTFTDANNQYLNYASIGNALLATGTAANPTCIGKPNGCIPYNIFTDGAVTPAQLNYLYELGTAQGSSTLRTIHGEMTGQLGKYGITSPLATDGVGVNFGYEHRNDHEYLLPDSAEESGLLSGFGSAVAPIDNGVAVGEEFMEVRAPLVQDKPFAKDLLFDTGFRHSDYVYTGAPSTITNTYKFEVQWAPIGDYRLRASYDKAIRAPSVAELYTPPIVGLIGVGADPCAPPITFTLLQCERTGVTAAQYNNMSIPQGTASQLSQQTSGNSALKPEQAETYTFGINFAPSQVPHLTGSIDYYHILIKDEVGTIPYAVILNDCANTGNPMYCSQIVRQPNTGSLTGNSNAGGGYVIQKEYNLGTALNSGIDVQLNYKWELPPGYGALEFLMNGAYLQHAELTPLPGAHTYDCAGLFGFTCQLVQPRWRHIARATWDTPWNASFSATWRYLGAVNEDNNSGDPTLHFSTYGAYDDYNGRIPAYSYLDLAATWNVNQVVQLRAGANNVLDKDPPVINTYVVANGAANTYSAYDLFGRQLFVAFTAKF